MYNYIMKKSEEKLEKIYTYIDEFISDNGYPPTVREIGAHFDIKSTATVYYYLEKLRDAGRITQNNNKNRAMGIVQKKQSQVIYLPLVGNVSAGKGILAIENIEEQFPLPRDIFDGTDLYLLRVEGESMKNAGISNGDFVIVHSQNEAETGEIVVALWQEKATVKRLSSVGEKLVLHPENDAFDDIVLGEEDSPVIIGKVIGCLKRF